MIKAIIFDCFGVLTTDYWKEFVSSLPESLVEPARDLNYKYAEGQIKKDSFLLQIKRLTTRIPKVADNLLGSDITKNSELLELVSKLTKLYKIGLLSNIGSDWITESLLTTEEAELFDDIILSYKVGLAKPDEKIFELAASRLGVAPADCLMIDDSEGHCAAAQRTGMKTILYSNLSQAKEQLEELLSV